MKQLIFAVESDSRAKTDDRYIYKLVLYRYNLSDKDTKIQFVHMGEKNKFVNFQSDCKDMNRLWQDG